MNKFRRCLVIEVAASIKKESFKFPVYKILLFGTTATSRDDSDSDMDIAVVMDEMWWVCTDRWLGEISDQLYKLTRPLVDKYFPGRVVSPFHFTVLPRDMFEDWGRGRSLVVDEIWADGMEVI